MGKRILIPTLSFVIGVSLCSCMKTVVRSNNLSFEVLPSVSDSAPVEITWKILTDVQFKEDYDTELDAYYLKPTFGPSVKALEGKDVFITGYVIPVDYDTDF